MAEESRSNERSRHAVCSTEELAEDSAIVTAVEGVEVAVFCHDGEYYALNNVCPHQNGPLGEGKVEDGCVYCPWHGWQFDLESGEHVQGFDRAETYAVVVEDDQVCVEL